MDLSLHYAVVSANNLVIISLPSNKHLIYSRCQQSNKRHKPQTSFSLSHPLLSLPPPPPPHLQSFTNEQEAARAYDRAAVLVYGRGTAQNFFDQPFQDFAINEDADEEAWARWGNRDYSVVIIAHVLSMSPPFTNPLITSYDEEAWARWDYSQHVIAYLLSMLTSQ